MELRSAEIMAFDLLQGTRLLQRRWKIVLAAAVAAALMAVIATFFIPPTWESEVDIQIGALAGQPVEDAQTLARIVESEAIAQNLPGSDDSIRQPLRAQIVAGAPGGAAGSVAYLRVLARGRTPEEARARASQALDFVKRRHAEFAQKSAGYAMEYEDTLASAVEELRTGLSKLEALRAGSRTEAQDSTLAAILLQSQLEARQTHYILLSRELQELRIKRTLGTKETREIAPPSTPQRPIWPSRLVFAVVGGSLGLALAALGVLLIG